VALGITALARASGHGHEKRNSRKKQPSARKPLVSLIKHNRIATIIASIRATQPRAANIVIAVLVPIILFDAELPIAA
jgi:hypothetical protein